MRRGLQDVVRTVLNNRMKPGTKSRDDSVQLLVDNEDRKDLMVEFFLAILFVSTVNSHAVAGHLLNVMAIHPEWQDRIYNEIKATADAHATVKHLPLLDKLDRMPVSAWESASPSLDLCIKGGKHLGTTR